MKIVVFGPAERVGAIEGGSIVDLNYAFAKHAHEVKDEPFPYAAADLMVPSNLATFIESGPRALDSARKAIEYMLRQDQKGLGPRGESIVYPGGSVKIHPPLASRAVRIVAPGGNYADHRQGVRLRSTGVLLSIEEITKSSREAGFWGFWKLTQTTVGPDDDIIYPARAMRLDYEGEVAVILGRRGKDIQRAEAHSYFWGYTLHHDWTIRGDRESPGAMHNFALAKNFDTASTLGPCIAVDEGLDPQNIDFETRVNGELRQRGNTRDMLFSFAEMLEHVASDLTMWPGDIISGGTPAGTVMDTQGINVDPSLYLKPGDVLVLSSPQIGSMRNRIVAKPPPGSNSRML